MSSIIIKVDKKVDAILLRIRIRENFLFEVGREFQRGRLNCIGII